MYLGVFLLDPDHKQIPVTPYPDLEKDLDPIGSGFTALFFLLEYLQWWRGSGVAPPPPRTGSGWPRATGLAPGSSAAPPRAPPPEWWTERRTSTAGKSDWHWVGSVRNLASQHGYSRTEEENYRYVIRLRSNIPELSQLMVSVRPGGQKTWTFLRLRW